MTYLEELTNEQLRREVACRINGGHEFGYGLPDSDFYRLIPSNADLTGEEMAVISEKLNNKEGL